MPMFDLPRDQLVDYSPDLPVPDDLDEFWSATLTEFRAAAVPPSFELLGTGLTLVDTNDVIFSGFGGDHVRGWLRTSLRARPARCPRSSATRVTAAVAYSPTKRRSGLSPAARRSQWTRAARERAGAPATRRTRPAARRATPAS